MQHVDTVVEPPRLRKSLRKLHAAAHELAAIGDVLGDRATALLARWIEAGRPATPAARVILDELFQTARTAVARAAAAVASGDELAAQEVLTLGETAHTLAEKALAAQAEHLGAAGPGDLATLRWELDFVNLLREVTGHAVHCASTVLPEVVAA